MISLAEQVAVSSSGGVPPHVLETLVTEMKESRAFRESMRTFQNVVHNSIRLVHREVGVLNETVTKGQAESSTNTAKVLASNDSMSKQLGQINN